MGGCQHTPHADWQCGVTISVTPAGPDMPSVRVWAARGMVSDCGRRRETASVLWHPFWVRPVNVVRAVVAGVLGGYAIITILNNLGPAHDPLPPGGVVQTKLFVNRVERENRAQFTRVVSREIWTIATARPEAVVACVDLLVAKEDLLDRFGNPLSKDVRLLEGVATKLDQVRRYPSADAYVDDHDGAARWQERPCS